MKTVWWVACLALALSSLLGGCGCRYLARPLEPAAANSAASGMQVSDDGTVTYAQDRLEIGVRPVTDEELNRQFGAHSQAGIFSANPYTFANWVDPELGTSPARFTVFRLKVKNYRYPKMRVEPLTARLVAQNGRQYAPLSLAELELYFEKYLTAYSGNNYALFKERVGILRNTLYSGEMVFSGQEAEGFLVFPALHPDVREVRLQLRDVIVRFDVWNEPVEHLDIEYVFERRVEKIHPDGTRSAGT